MITKSVDAQRKGIKTIAELMVIAARTAPKANAVDNLEIIIVEGNEKDKLAEEMRRIGDENGIDFIKRDGGNVDLAQVVVLFGTKIDPIDCPNCGFCGYKNCSENRIHGGICAFNTGDLGIAIGSAVSVAANHRCDNRVMFSVGKAALNLGYFDHDVRIAYGVPLSVSGKSPFYDRG
ncbi:ferredoxin [Lutibacter sp. B2]|nr:ferredoxin [Lutibacter sp. B2]